MLDKMRDLRPVVETGYENALLVRLLIEEVLDNADRQDMYTNRQADKTNYNQRQFRRLNIQNTKLSVGLVRTILFCRVIDV